MRHTGNTLSYEYSTNLQGWTPIHTETPSPSWLVLLTHLNLGVVSGTGGAVLPALFDNLNRCPR
jgi:hypothetical protein